MPELLKTKQALTIVHDIIAKYSLAFDSETGKLMQGFLFRLLGECTDDDSEALLITLLGEDYEEKYCGEYKSLLSDGEAAFIANFETYLSTILFPFEKTSYNYGNDIAAICSTPNTTGALSRIKVTIPASTQIIWSVYFNPLCKESLEYLNTMSLEDFTHLKLALDIRSAGQEEVEYKRYSAQKAQRRT